MMITAEMINAETALKYGLVNYVFDDYKNAYSKAIDIIDIIKRKAPIAIKNVIMSVNSFYDSNLNGFEEEIKLFVQCSSTKDFKEGVKAFIEKRCPDFKGE